MNAGFAKSKFSDSGPKGGLWANSPAALRSLSDFGGRAIGPQAERTFGGGGSACTRLPGRAPAAGPYLTKYHLSVLYEKMYRNVNIEKWGDAYRLVYMCPKKRTGRNDTNDYELPGDTGGLDCGDRQRENSCPTAERRTRRNDGSDADRLENNVARARSRVRELASCNPWDYFATFTIDGHKQDRFNLAMYSKRLGEWFGNFNRDYKAHVSYLVVPEQHKNGAYHAHGLLSGIPAGALTVNEHGHLDWPRYRARFGFISLDPVRDRLACAAYITKYVSKDLDSTHHEKGEHLFYASRGLEGRQRLGAIPVSSSARAEYEGEWCGLQWSKAGPLFNLLRAYEAEPGDKARVYALMKYLESINK